MPRLHLRAGVALCALMAANTQVAAQSAPPPVNLSADNAGSVGTNPGSITLEPQAGAAGAVGLSVGASLSIAATGASASYNLSALEGDFNVSNLQSSLGTVSMAVRNSGAVSSTSNTITLKNPFVSALGSSVGISISGAAASMSIQSTSANGIVLGSVPAIGQLTQSSTNATTTGDAGGDVRIQSGRIVIDNRDVTAADFGIGTSYYISATGAVASLSYAGIQTIGPAIGLNPPAAGATTVGLQQTSTNASTVDNLDSAFVLTGRTPAQFEVNVAAGVSASISASGAVASLAFQATSATLGAFSSGSISQTASNSGAVTNRPASLSIFPMNLLDAGVSLSFSAVGSSASWSLSGLASSTPSLGATINGAVTQTAVNSGVISNGALPGAIGQPYQFSGNQSGIGASIAYSATGASSAISTRQIQTSDQSTLTVTGDIRQTSQSTSTASVANSSVIALDAALTGLGSSVAMSATGAAASIDRTSIAATLGPQIFQGSVSQDVSNAAQVSNTISQGTSVTTLSGLSGLSASASFSATGSVASISGSILEAPNSNARNTFQGMVTQQASNAGAVSICCSLAINAIPSVGSLISAGTSVSLSASGATAAIGMSAINPLPGVQIDGLELQAGLQQQATNSAAITAGSTTPASAPRLSVDAVSGAGSSLSLTATGAAASLSTTLVSGSASSNFTGLILNGDVIQSATNTGSILAGSPTLPAIATLTMTGALSGPGSSVSIGATGAVASVSSAAIASAGSFTPFFSGVPLTISQSAQNSGSILTGASIEGVSASGRGAAVSIASTGASTSFSNTAILTAQVPATASESPAISQSAINGAPGGAPLSIVTTGAISATGEKGVGASLSIGATGASSSISLSNILDCCRTAGVIGNASQAAVNHANASVRTTGSITVSSLGVGASASIYAVGASSSVSYRSVR